MERLSITHGMSVVDAQGRELGIVEFSSAEHVLFRHGFLNRHLRAAALKDVANLEDGAVRLREGAAILDGSRPDVVSGIHQNVLPFRRELLENAEAHG